MLIIKYIISISYPVLQLLCAGAMCWLYVKNRKMPFFWLMISILSVILMDVIEMLFPTEIYIVALGKSAKTYAYYIQLGLGVLQYLFLFLAGVAFLRIDKGATDNSRRVQSEHYNKILERSGK